jgi:cell division septation protein DedD
VAAPLRGAFSVQVGAFSVEENARGLAARLQEASAVVRVLEFRDNRGTWWRVRVTGYAGEDQARAAAARFVEQGLGGFVVRED